MTNGPGYMEGERDNFSNDSLASFPGRFKAAEYRLFVRMCEIRALVVYFCYMLPCVQAKLVTQINVDAFAKFLSNSTTV